MEKINQQQLKAICKDMLDTATPVPISRLVRVSFCGMPALLWGALFAIFDPTIGGICAIAGFWLGWQCTEAKPERGESKYEKRRK